MHDLDHPGSDPELGLGARTRTSMLLTGRFAALAS
jgi:hypothetical protein